MQYKIYDLILMFFIYAALGWGCEVAFAACKEGRFINRGFLNGPVCPIYGVGVIGVVLALWPVRENLLYLYVGSVVLTSAIEFVTGFVLEKLFHARWWDYSDAPLNIMGYVCVLFSMVWGVGCVLVMRIGHPMVALAVESLPDGVCIALDSVFGVVFITDLCATVSTVRKLSDRLRRLSELGVELHAISDEIGQGISHSTLSAKAYVQSGQQSVRRKGSALLTQLETLPAHISDWLEARRESADAQTNALRARFDAARTSISQLMSERSYSYRRILDAFPNLTSERYQEAVEALRALYEKRSRKR